MGFTGNMVFGWATVAIFGNLGVRYQKACLREFNIVFQLLAESTKKRTTSICSIRDALISVVILCFIPPLCLPSLHLEGLIAILISYHGKDTSTVSSRLIFCLHTPPNCFPRTDWLNCTHHSRSLSLAVPTGAPTPFWRYWPDVVSPVRLVWVQFPRQLHSQPPSL